MKLALTLAVLLAAGPVLAADNDPTMEMFLNPDSVDQEIDKCRWKAQRFPFDPNNPDDTLIDWQEVDAMQIPVWGDPQEPEGYNIDLSDLVGSQEMVNVIGQCHNPLGWGGLTAKGRSFPAILVLPLGPIIED
jgi:hypothetical protein